MLPPLLLALTSSLAPMLAAPAVPKNWPLGQPVPVTHQNNGPTPSYYFQCEPVVLDSQGQLVRAALCGVSPSWLMPGETWTTWWDQRDHQGQQVPAGTYFVDGKPYRVGNAPVAIAALGAPHPGAARRIELSVAAAPGADYLLAAALSSAMGTPLGCGHVLPLDTDALLSISLANSPFFVDFAGTLDAAGRTTAPTIALPAAAWLQGIGFDVAAVIFDPVLPCGVRHVSAAEHLVVQ